MDTIGVVESAGIAAGVELSDGMVKAANVELVKASAICSGRYLILVAGDRQAVESSVNFARASGRKLAESFVISNISRQVLDALKTTSQPEPGDALGVIECRNVSSGINAADHAVKRSAVTLLRFVAGTGIVGKSYFVISGEVASVKEAASAAGAALGENLIETVVIPRPDAAVFKALTGTR